MHLSKLFEGDTVSDVRRIVVLMPILLEEPVVEHMADFLRQGITLLPSGDFLYPCCSSEAGIEWLLNQESIAVDSILAVESTAKGLLFSEYSCVSVV